MLLVKNKKGMFETVGFIIKRNQYNNIHIHKIRTTLELSNRQFDF